MWEWLKNGKNLSGLGSLVSAGGSIYGGIKQADAAKDMIDLNKEQFKFNKKLLADDEARRKKEIEDSNRIYGNGLIAL